MASFISALSLFVFVLISGCFTLPIADNFLPETSSPFAFDVTTETSVNERMFPEATTVSLFDGLTTGDAIHEPRAFDDVATDESFTFEPTTEGVNQEPRVFNEAATEESFTFEPTTERSFHEKRGVEDTPSEMTMEETTERDELALREIPAETFTESSPRRLHSVESVRPTTEVYRGIQGWSQPSTTVESRMTTSEMHTSSTTKSTPSMPSTITPELHTRDSTTTRKYTGLLADKLDHEVESDEADHEHKKLLGKDKFVESKQEEKKLNKEKIVAEEHEEIHGKVKPEIDEDKFEKITTAPKKFKETHEHEKLDTKDDKPTKFTKEEMELEEHTPELDKVKTVEHKEFVSKHDEDEKFHKGHKLDSDEPKKEFVKESYEEFKKQPKPEFEEAKKETYEEFKKQPKPEFEEMKKESHEEFKKQPKPEFEEAKKETHEEFKKHPKPEFEEMKKESHEEMKKLPKPEFDEEKTVQKGYKLTKEETKKPVEKESSEEKKDSPKQEGELEEDIYPEKFIPKRPTTPRRPQIDSDDNTEYPKALYFDKTWTSVVKIPSDFAILDETTDVVTVPDTFRPSKSVDSRRDESKLNQGQESARAE